MIEDSKQGLKRLSFMCGILLGRMRFLGRIKTLILIISRLLVTATWMGLLASLRFQLYYITYNTLLYYLYTLL